MIPKTVITLVISFFVLSCESTDPYQGQYIDLSFNEKVTFGQPDSLSESTVHFSRDVRVGPNGKIYIADAGVSKIKVFSQEGKFVNSFGDRGRGPGELTGIRGFAVTDSTVLVWDQNMQRISGFNLDGEFKKAYKLKGVASPMLIYPLGQSYLAFHMDEHRGDKIWESQLANIYPNDFKQRKENFLKLKDIDERIGKLPETLTLWFGDVLIKNNKKFLFIPFIYNGNIYEYSKTSNGWTKTNIYKGLNRQKPYSFIENTNGRKPDATLSSNRISERRSYLIHNWSKGVFEYKEYVFNFTFSDVEDQRVFGVEVYDEDMEPVGYSPIKSIPITNKEDNFLSWFVEDVDEHGNFYFLQRNDEGTKIRVMQIGQQDLENL